MSEFEKYAGPEGEEEHQLYKRLRDNLQAVLEAEGKPTELFYPALGALVTIVANLCLMSSKPSDCAEAFKETLDREIVSLARQGAQGTH